MGKVHIEEKAESNENVLTQLHEACRAGNMQEVSDLIAKYPDALNATCSRGMSALHYSVIGGHSALTELLASNSAVNLNSKADKSALHLAAEMGNVEITLMLIGKGARVNAPDVNGNTPLDLALMNGHKEVVKTLLKFSAFSRQPTLLHMAVPLASDEIINLIARDLFDVDSKDDKGRSALHLAAEKGSGSVVETLLKVGADVKTKCCNGRNPLHYAATSGEMYVVQILLIKGADVNEADSLGLTPLHLACQKGYSNIVSFLIENHADIDASSLGKLTPLHYAAINNHPETVSKLLEAGAAKNPTTLEGFTPLALALVVGNRDITDILIKHGASLNSKTAIQPLHVSAAYGFKDVAARILLQDSKDLNEKDQSGKTPLFRAAEEGHLDVIKVLLKHQASHSTGCTTDNKTPLHIASENGHTDIVNCLLLGGANHGVKDINGQTPLHLAVSGGHVDTIKELATNKAQINMEDPNGNSPLHLAPENGKFELLNVLITCGADVTKKNYSGDTVLHNAARRGRQKMVKEIIEKYEVPVDTPNNSNQRPIHLASAEGHEEVIDYLSKTADINYADKYGLTPLHLATEGGHLKCMEILIKNKAKLDAKIKGQVTRQYIDKNNKTVQKTSNGETILHLAALIDDDNIADEVVKYLLTAGLDFNAVDLSMRTPLHLAVQKGHLKTSETLLEHGADSEAKEYSGYVPLNLASADKKEQFESLFSRYTQRR